MENPNSSIATAIEHIPGLYISESAQSSHPVDIRLTKASLQFAQSPDLLTQQGITHVLSLTNPRNCPKIEEHEMNISHLYLDIEDNPMEDLLICLDGLCAWIAHALGSGADALRDGNAQNKSVSVPRTPKVLVHCIQGISRSGSIVIAYLMRSLALSYDDALGVARTYRPSIAPNSGFAEQLRVWEGMEHAVFVVRRVIDQKEVSVKTEYEEWKAGRGVLLSRGEVEKEKARMERMKGLVGRFEIDRLPRLDLQS